MENVAGEQGLALQQLFPYRFLNFFKKNFNRHKISSFNCRGLKLGNCFFNVDMLFPFLSFFNPSP